MPAPPDLEPDPPGAIAIDRGHEALRGGLDEGRRCNVQILRLVRPSQGAAALPTMRRDRPGHR